MEFVRKNLGFAIFAVASAVLLVVLIILDREAAAELADGKEKSDKQQEFIRQVSRGKYALNNKNLKRARSNHAIAKTELNDFLRFLEEQYTLPERTMDSGVECVGEVRKTIRELSALLDQRDIQTEEEQYFSFRELAKSSYPPPKAQVPVILKQLDMATMVVQAAADAYVTEFHSLERLDTPGQEPDIARGGFQAALYRVTVSGTGARIRSFINALNELDHVLLLIKRCEISRDQQALGRKDADPGERSRRSRGRPSSSSPPPQYEEMPGMAPPPSERDQDEDETDILPRRQRRVFEDMPLRAKITFGLLEFRGPDEDTDGGQG